MLKRLKGILNSYSDEELDTMDLYINSNSVVGNIIVDTFSIDLVDIDFKVITKPDFAFKED